MEKPDNRQTGFGPSTSQGIILTEERTHAVPGTFENKHKERLPEDTIRIIKSFFEEEGFDIKETAMYDTGVGIYSCTITLNYKGHQIGLSNGKGVTGLYSKASAYAELYERFCLLEFQDEPLSLSYLYDGCNTRNIKELTAFYHAIYRTGKKGVLDKTLAYLYGEELPVVPFDSLTGGEPAYLNPIVMINIDGSNGMAAGNTIEEALVQGFSEIFERYVEEKIFYGEKVLKKVPLALLENEFTWAAEKTKELLKKGFHISFYDASERTGLPVMSSLCIDLKRGQHYINIGASPCFETALERTITETFQGIGNIEEEAAKFIPNVAFKDHSLKAYEQFTMNGMQISSEEPFIGCEDVTEINRDVYIQRNAGNHLQLERIKAIAEKEGIHLYHRDFSLHKDIKAVFCVSPELNNVLIKDSEMLLDEGLQAANEFISFTKKKQHTYGECIRLLELVDCFLPMESRIVFDSYYYSPVQRNIVSYVQFALSIKLGEFKKAEEIGLMELTESAKKCLLIKHMVCYITYLNQGYTKEKIREMLTLWQVPENIITALERNDESFDKTFIFDVIYGAEYEKRKEASEEIFMKVLTLRKKLADC